MAVSSMYMLEGIFYFFIYVVFYFLPIILQVHSEVYFSRTNESRLFILIQY